MSSRGERSTGTSAKADSSRGRGTNRRAVSGDGDGDKVERSSSAQSRIWSSIRSRSRSSSGKKGRRSSSLNALRRVVTEDLTTSQKKAPAAAPWSNITQGYFQRQPSGLPSSVGNQKGSKDVASEIGSTDTSAKADSGRGRGLRGRAVSGDDSDGNKVTSSSSVQSRISRSPVAKEGGRSSSVNAFRRTVTDSATLEKKSWISSRRTKSSAAKKGKTPDTSKSILELRGNKYVREVDQGVNL
jgi:hypothetical protein